MSNTIDNTALPFGLAPAPKILNRVSRPLDLSEAGPDYVYLTGWKVIIDMGVDMSVNDLIAVAVDDGESMKTRNAALEEWVKKMCAAWNFIDNNTGEPLPQPRDGGASQCPQDAFRALTLVAQQVLQPKKA